MKTGKTMRTIWLATAIVLLGISLCAAQVATSMITGVVQDAEGLLVVGAKVMAKNEGTGVSYETTTTSAGTYTLSALPPAEYTITVTHPGFRTFTSVHNVLTVGTPLVVDAKLTLGQLSEVVQVESSYARVETSNAMVSDVVTRKEVVELPLNGRNPLNLIVLEPGLVQRTNNAAGSGTHVFGSRDRAHNITVDGIDANESSVPNPQNNILRLNPDNVQEYRVVTHNATPEFGRNSGANVTVATRSGTNEYHGDVYYFHRNTALNSNEWFNSTQGQGKPVLLLHQFGADGGGPIIKNRTFFFASYQGNRIKQTQPITNSFGIPLLYTPQMKNGTFRFVKGTVNGLKVNSPKLVDASGNYVAGVRDCEGQADNNCIAKYDIFDPNSTPLGVSVAPDAKVAALVNTLPKRPNDFSQGDGLNFAGFNWNPPSAFSGPHLLFRVDHKFNDNNNIFVRYLHSSYDATQGDLLNGRPSVYPGFPPLGEVFRVGRNLATSYRHVFSPNVVNDFTMGYNYFRFTFTFGESNPNFNDPTKDVPYGQSCIQSSFQTISAPFCNSPHTQRAVSTLQWIDNLSVVRGAHSVRTGINFRFYRHNDSRGLAGGQNINPTILFIGDESATFSRPPVGWMLPAALDRDSNDFHALQNVIVEQAGIPAELDQAFAANLGTNTYGGLQVTGTRARQFDWYIQDEWKIARTLTMTYGLRWEFNLRPSDCCNRVVVPNVNIDGSQGTVTFQPADGWFQRKNANAFAPRISFAWNPKGGKTVIRAGYGIAFDTLSTFQITAVSGQVPGAVLNCRLRLGGQVNAGTIVSNTTNCATPTNFSQTIAGGFAMQLPPPTTTPSGTFSPPPASFSGAPGAAAFDPNLKVPTVHEWSLTMQRELPGGFVAQVGYIGKRGMRLYRAYDLNQIRADQPGFVQDFLKAQDNLLKGCQPDGKCPPGVMGASPTLLTALTPAGFINTDTVKGFLRQNAVGDLARRIDTLAFSTFSGKPQFGPNYFRPDPQFGTIFYFDSGGDSYYHAAIVNLRRRFEKGLTMGLSYTYGKSIDDMSVDPVGASSGGALSSTNSRTPTDVRNFRLDRSRSDFDDRHVLVADYLYDLPFGHGKRWGQSWPGFVNQVLGSWSLTGIYTFQSGEPFTINSGVRSANGFKVSRADVLGPMPSTDFQFLPGVQGPVVFDVSSNLVPDPRDARLTRNCKSVIGTQTLFCFPLAGQNGSARNAFQGPGFWNVDMGVLKNFPVTERFRLQFRAEFFNVFNHPNFENPRNSTTLDLNSRGANNLRSAVFGQTCCVTSSLPSSATVIAVGEPNRVIQFSLKVNF